MTKTFDATLNSLIDAHVADWATFLAARAGVPAGPATALDTDLSATLQADRLFRIDAPAPAVLHLELESGGRLGIPGELLRYNVAAWGAIGLPIHSVLVLLRPKATATDLTGSLDLVGADGRPYLTFRYTVVRVWQESVDSLLTAGLGVAPLAMLTNEAAADLRGAFIRLRHRLRDPGLPDTVAEELFGSTFVLCGLRYDRTQIEDLYRDLSMTLENSTTYQLILERGIAQEAQAMVLRLGTKRFGPPSPATEAAVRGIPDRDRLEQIAERVLDATGWDDLLVPG
ncbi:MAG: hypothetical protein JWO38_5731 [Gemmataceae bacterium]|nr:hypothetical protein [Gemmataceae bacterium]